MNSTESSERAPCPFCGKTETLKTTTARELAEQDSNYDGEFWEHSDSFAVMCDAHMPGGPGGCGASGGFFPTEREAIEAWNRRASGSAAPAEPCFAQVSEWVVDAQHRVFGVVEQAQHIINLYRASLASPAPVPAAAQCQRCKGIINDCSGNDCDGTGNYQAHWPGASPPIAAEVGADAKPKLTKAQRRMSAVVAWFQNYVATYSSQPSYLDYRDGTFIDDMLYGMGAALDENSHKYAQGYDVWKAKLRAHIAAEVGEAALDVLAERRRQVEAEGWTPEHDDEHGDGILAEAGACYAAVGPWGPMPMDWPWEPAWWKPKDRRSNLVRAGALILAEIERMDRAAMKEQP